MYFGNYPQSKVSDSSIISSLNAKSGTLPTLSNTYKWSTGYEYYSKYLYYIDIDQDKDGSNDYRGVYFTENFNSNQTNGYSPNTVYWFKYEPIKWDILTKSNNKAFIISNLLLDTKEYNYTLGDKSSAGNNYMHSDIRLWLNTTFYETAFTSLEQQIIKTTTVDNSASSTSSSSNSYACANTNDKMFLLSYKEAKTYYSSDAQRQAQGSDYAKSQGLSVSTDSDYKGNFYYWLRSPHYEWYSHAGSVDETGDIQYAFASLHNHGVRAACWINL